MALVVEVRGAAAIQILESGKLALWVEALTDGDFKTARIAEVESITITAPSNGGAGWLTIFGSQAQTVRLAIDWANLTALAETARRALIAAPVDGQG